MARVKNETQSDQMSSWSYEERVGEIESIIARIESGELDLEEVFKQFAWAVECLQECQVFLQDRQKQVDLLIETLKDD
ncbi:MAG: exodeoxyribonuclease VII small subunit [Calothrix sp. MO_192.B10]|nr:exodeoxyribonuclease VII small subunit [Calothrix sp. MO_192.B10]